MVYRVMCQFAIQASIAYVQADNEKQAVEKVMDHPLYQAVPGTECGIRYAYVLSTTDQPADID